MKKNNKKGFTLVELVIVVAVMAILVAVAIPTVSGITKTAKENVFKSNCQTIESMLKLEEAELDTAGTAVTNGLSSGQVKTALSDAKLNITDTTSFYYHPATGAVNGTTAENAIEIKFDANGALVKPE